MGRPGEINCSACCSAQAGAYDGSMLMPPRFLFIDVNLACNLRCAHCFFWKRDEATERLARNHGVIASFSRALAEGLLAQQSDAEFNAQLDASIQSIYEASTAKV